MKIDVWDLYCFEEHPEEMEIIDIDRWEIDDFKINDFITYISSFFNEEYDDVKHFTIHNIEGLFDEEIEFECDKDFYTIQIDFFHPKMIRSATFDYENFIRSRLKTIGKSIKKIYKTKIFWLIDYVNYLANPIAKIILIIEDN